MTYAPLEQDFTAEELEHIKLDWASGLLPARLDYLLEIYFKNGLRDNLVPQYIEVVRNELQRRGWLHE
jgi:hypothetical protein